MNAIPCTSAAKQARNKGLRLMIACLIAPLLGSCRGQESARCSAPETIATVKSLMGENSDNPLLSKMNAALHTAYSIDAVRTISSSSREAFCEARLTVKFQLAQGADRGISGQPQTAADRAFNRQMMEQLATRFHDITYKVETNDDGQAYVTIVPSDADVRSQQDQTREQQLEQNQRDDAERQREYQQEQDDQRTREWEQRQQQLEQQAPRD